MRNDRFVDIASSLEIDDVGSARNRNVMMDAGGTDRLIGLRPSAGVAQLQEGYSCVIKSSTEQAVGLEVVRQFANQIFKQALGLPERLRSFLQAFAIVVDRAKFKLAHAQLLTDQRKAVSGTDELPPYFDGSLESSTSVRRLALGRLE